MHHIWIKIYGQVKVRFMTVNKSLIKSRAGKKFLSTLVLIGKNCTTRNFMYFSATRKWLRFWKFSLKGIMWSMVNISNIDTLIVNYKHFTLELWICNYYPVSLENSLNYIFLGTWISLVCTLRACVPHAEKIFLGSPPPLVRHKNTICRYTCAPFGVLGVRWSRL